MLECQPAWLYSYRVTKQRHIGIVTTDAHQGVAFARLCSVYDPAKTLKLIRSGCPLPARFEMLVRAVDVVTSYNGLRRYLMDQPGVHATQRWSPWFVYNNPFADAVTAWCTEMVKQGIIEPDVELASKWVGNDRPLPVIALEDSLPVGVVRRVRREIKPANQ